LHYIFKPEEIVGKQVVVVATCSPEDEGIEAIVMILMADDKEDIAFCKP